MGARLTWIKVSKRTWLRGQASSWLWRKKDGKKCCIGFGALQTGIAKPSRLKGIATMWDLGMGTAPDGAMYSVAVCPAAQAFEKKHNNTLARLYGINDSDEGRYGSDEDRIEALNVAARKGKFPWRFKLVP